LKVFTKIIYGLAALLLLTSCSMIDMNQLNEKAKVVRIYDHPSQIKDCRFIADIVGTQGHWYNSLYVSNKDLVFGAMNDIKNQANTLGANAIYTQDIMLFATSVTIWGQAYHCQQ